MSLFSSIQLANNALQAHQIGLQVVGNNIANAATPGYIRQRTVLTPAQTQRDGDLLLGLGVDVTAIVQETDKLLAQRLRTATSDLVQSETRQRVFTELESLLGELSDTDLSTLLSGFFGSLNDVLNQPEDLAVRNLARLEGETLATAINQLSGRALQVRADLDQQVVATADDINRLLHDIAKLNVQIVTTEGGSTSASDAVGLRDQRNLALTELSEIIDINAVEQEDGSVSVFAGGEFIVFAGTVRPVRSRTEIQNGVPTTSIELEATQAPIRSASGRLAGLLGARDEIVDGFLANLDELAGALIFEFNKVHSGGQGLSGFDAVTSEHAVDDVSAALDQADLPFRPVNGSFQLLVTDRQTGSTKTTDISVQLRGDEGDLSLEGLAAQLDAIDGVSARVGLDRRLHLESDSENIEFSFRNDTSGVLAALGVNSFFTGRGATDIGVSRTIAADASKFAASAGGVGQDTLVAEKLAQLFETPLAGQNGASLAGLYNTLASETTQSAAVSRSVAEGFRVFQKTLEGQHLAISGVNIDEEVVRMIQLQRGFQASARFIRTVTDLLDDLVNL